MNVVSKFLLVLISVWQLGANSSEAKQMSLQEIGKVASENASLIRAQTKELEAAKLDIEGAGLLANPAASIQLGGLRSGDASGKTVEAFLSQTIPFPGKLSNQKHQKEMESQITKVSLEQARTLIQHQAVLLGVQWLAFNENIKHFQERQKRFQQIRQYFKTRPLVSPATKVDAQLIETQIALIERRFAEMEKNRRLVERQLQFYLQSTEPIQPRADWIALDRIDVASMRNHLQPDRNPELQKKRLDVEQAKIITEQSRLRSLPDFTLGLGYRNEAVSPSNHFYYGSLGVTIPIFDRGQYSVPAGEARIDAETAREQLLRSKIQTDLDSALIEIESAKQIAESLPIKKGEGLDVQFANMGREFQKGRITTSAFLQADEQLHEVTASIYEAQFNLAQSLSQFRVLLGEPLSWE